MSETPTARRHTTWAAGVVLAIAVAAMSMGFPFVVTWTWPHVDSMALTAGTMFFGMILGSAAVVGFLLWLWREDRR